jgi:hypothetical protein
MELWSSTYSCAAAFIPASARRSERTSAAWPSISALGVGALAGPGEIVVSSTVKELVVGSDMQFTDRGEHELKGVPGSWHLYTLGEERTPLLELDGAAGYMRRSDRVAVTLARRMPRTMRLAGQLTSRGTSPA